MSGNVTGKFEKIATLNYMKNKRGIKTVINLRGVRNCSSYFLEKETCKKHKAFL